MPATPPITPPTTCCWTGERLLLFPPPPPDAEPDPEVAAAPPEVIEGEPVAPAPGGKESDEVADETDAVPVVKEPDESVKVVENSPNVYVLVPPLPPVLITVAPVGVALATKAGSVTRSVPLIKDTSKVDVAVTVTVPSSLLLGVMVPLEFPEMGGSVELELDVKDVMVDVFGKVVLREVVATEPVAPPVAMVEFETGGMVTETAVVKAPTSVNETTATVVATGT